MEPSNARAPEAIMRDLKEAAANLATATDLENQARSTACAHRSKVNRLEAELDLAMNQFRIQITTLAGGTDWSRKP